MTFNTVYHYVFVHNFLLSSTKLSKGWAPKTDIANYTVFCFATMLFYYLTFGISGIPNFRRNILTTEGTAYNSSLQVTKFKVKKLQRCKVAKFKLQVATLQVAMLQVKVASCKLESWEGYSCKIAKCKIAS